MPSSNLFKGKKTPDHFAFMDITDGFPIDPPLNLTNVEPDLPLQARKDVNYCVRDPARSGVCVAIGGAVALIGTQIGVSFKSASDNKDCSTHNGHIDNFTWSTYATGKQCDTTAQLKTIAGAINVYLRSQNDSVCGTHCVKLTHGGTWTGYVIIAPQGTSLNGYYCGTSSQFGQCGTGGGGDDHN